MLYSHWRAQFCSKLGVSSHHLQSEQVETGFLGAINSLLFYVTLVGFLYGMIILQRGTPCILRFLIRVCLYNSTFRKLQIFTPH